MSTLAKSDAVAPPLPNLAFLMHTDVARIGFLLMSAVLAVTRPFEVFLMAYLVLGPLHYLSRIGGGFRYAYGSRTWTSVAVVCGAVSASIVGSLVLPSKINLYALPALLSVVVLFGVLAAFPFSNRRLWAGGAAIVLLVSAIAPQFRTTNILYCLMLPTVGHFVLVTFSGLFKDATLKRSAATCVLLFGYIAVIGAIVVFTNQASRIPGQTVMHLYGLINPMGIADGPISMNLEMMRLLGVGDLDGKPGLQNLLPYWDFLYRSPASYAFTSILAFTYLFHYLDTYARSWNVLKANISWGRVAGLGGGSLAVTLIGIFAPLGMYFVFAVSFFHAALELPEQTQALLRYIVLWKQPRQ